MTPVAAVRMPNLTSHQGRHGLTINASVLATVPMMQVHLAIPLVIADRTDIAVLDVLSACWPELPAWARFEQFGGQIAVNRTQQWLHLSLLSTADRLPLLADTLAAVVGADYSHETVQAGARRIAQYVSLAAAQPAVDSTRRLWEAYYGHLPPFAELAPDPQEVDEVSAQQVAAAHTRCVAPGQAHLVVVGDLDPEHTVSCLDSALGSWAGPRQPAPQQPTAPPRLPGRRRVTHHRPWRQSHIRLAAPSAPRDDREGFAAALASSLILGGTFSSRIMTVLREQHGLAYRTSAALNDHRGAGILVVEADVAAPAATAAMSHLTRLLEEFATEGPTEQELAAAAGYTSGAHQLALGSQSTRASCLLSYLTAGNPLSDITDIPAMIAELTPSDVRKTAALYHPDQMSGVICGDTRQQPVDGV
jgi:zinc protease